MDMMSLTKKEIQSEAVNQVQKILDSGELNMEEVVSKIVKLKEYVNSFDKALRKNDCIPVGSYQGVKAVESNTGDRLDYEADPVYKKLKDELKAREEVLKAAFKNKDIDMADKNGEVIPRVPVKTYSSTVIKVSF